MSFTSVKPNLSFADIVANVSSTIVNIETKVTVETNPAEIFGPFMFQEPKKIERQALGSGVIVTRRGLIVTNDHVIEKADKIRIITADEQQYDGDVVLRDTLHDLAIIRMILDDDDDYYWEDEDDDDDDDEDEDEEAAYDEDEDEDEEDEDEDGEEEPPFDKSELRERGSRGEQKRSTVRGGGGGKNARGKRARNAKRKKKRSTIRLHQEGGAHGDELIEDDSYVFPCIKFGRAETCAVGDFVLAIGNNLGFHGTVTDGIISAIGRTNDARLPIAYPQFPLIQTNASINPGSSGGALVNMRGELIGVNESIATSTGGNVGVGFAVPVNFIRPLLRAAINRGLDVERVWDGISPLPMPISTVGKNSNLLNRKPAEAEIGSSSASPALSSSVLTSDVFSKYGRAYPRGICVKSIHKKSPAFKAGLQKRDVILRIDGIDMDNVNTYYLLIAGSDPEQKLKYHVIRETNGQTQHRNRSRNRRSSRRMNANTNSGGGGKNNKRKKMPNNSLYDISWTDFESYEELDIFVPIALIPPPSKKPMEIKDRINPFYGSEVVELCPAINSDFGLDFNQSGVAIWDIEHGSQADKLNFRIGDIILYADNIRIRKLEDVESIGERMQMRKNCRIKFKRSGKINHVDVYLRSRRRYSRL